MVVGLSREKSAVSNLARVVEARRNKQQRTDDDDPSRDPHQSAEERSLLLALPWLGSGRSDACPRTHLSPIVVGRGRVAALNSPPMTLVGLLDTLPACPDSDDYTP